MLSHRRRLACLEATADSCPLLARRANKRSKTPVEAARCTRETSNIEHGILLYVQEPYVRCQQKKSPKQVDPACFVPNLARSMVHLAARLCCEDMLLYPSHHSIGCCCWWFQAVRSCRDSRLYLPNSNCYKGRGKGPLAKGEFRNFCRAVGKSGSARLLPERPPKGIY